jgi:Phosphotransferase System HPr (HPr) Family
MAQRFEFIVEDPVGLYAGPASQLVDCVKQLYSHMTLRYNNKEVNLKSTMGVLSLGIPAKAKIEIIAEGEDEKRAIEIVKDKIIELNISSIED